MDRFAFMRACREGGVAIEQALRTLDQCYCRILLTEAIRGLHDSDAAADLVQETFIKVWQRCATFQGDSELLPWIRSILRHGLIDRLRARAREVPLDDEQDPDLEVGARIADLSREQIPTPDVQARRRQQDECFRLCWERFQRTAPAHALVMSWIVEDGLTNEEIAQLLGRTPGATREFISQCRKRARIHLAEWRQLVADDAENPAAADV